MSLSVWHWLIVLLVALIVVPPFWIITKRTGRPGLLGVLVLVPVVGYVFIWWLALSEWPRCDGKK